MIEISKRTWERICPESMTKHRVVKHLAFVGNDSNPTVAVVIDKIESCDDALTDLAAALKACPKDASEDLMISFGSGVGQLERAVIARRKDLIKMAKDTAIEEANVACDEQARKMGRLVTARTTVIEATIKKLVKGREAAKDAEKEFKEIEKTTKALIDDIEIMASSSMMAFLRKTPPFGLYVSKHVLDIGRFNMACEADLLRMAKGLKKTLGDYEAALKA
jgi:hypothetical protein